MTDQIKLSNGCPTASILSRAGAPATSVVPVPSFYAGSNIPVVNPLPVSAVAAAAQPNVYAGSNIPVVNPLPASVGAAAPPPSVPSVESATTSSAGLPATTPLPSTPQYLIYFNPANKDQQKIIYTNQFGEPLSSDDQKFIEYQLQYSKVQQPGYNTYKVLWPKKKT